APHGLESVQRLHIGVQGAGTDPAVQGHSQTRRVLGAIVRLARFPLGRIVATPGALSALEQTGETPGLFLKRHVTGDWGEADEEDGRENELSVVQGCRLLSAYTL